jgi:DNA ligase-1
MIKYEKLTRRDARNMQWFYWAEVHSDPPRYYTFTQKTRTGTIRRSDATYPRTQSLRSPRDQCIFEVEALYKKKRRLDWETYTGKGYRSPNRPDKRRHYKPMLAQKYPHLRPILPTLAQPKLDGVRCCATRDGLWTRKNKAITSVPHLARQIEQLFQTRPDLLALDGELYVHGWSLSRISGLVRRSRPCVESTLLEFHVFDAEFQDSPEMPMETRWRLLQQIRLDKPVHPLGGIHLVETQVAEDQEDLDFLHAKWTKQGYEGSMYRNMDMPYMHKRSYALIKRKDFQTEEFTLLDITEGNGAWRGAAKRFHYRARSGATFETGVRGTIDEMRKVLKNKHKYIGKPCTVRYLYLDKKSGVPQIPVTIELARSDK